MGEKYQKMLVSILIAYATGILLTASFLGLIPEAIEGLGGEPYTIMLFILGGILFFFFMEKILIWRNCRDKACEVHSQASGPIVLFGDSFHNLTDGIVIAAAFLTDFALGIAAGITILIHEIAQETGDFAILLHSGYSKKKAFIYNIISSITTIPAAIITYYLLTPFLFIVPFLLAIAAASFIYIALTDLTPELHKHTSLKYNIRQSILIIAGILTMFMVLSLSIHTH